VIEYGQMTQISVWEIYSQHTRAYSAAKYPSHTRAVLILLVFLVTFFSKKVI